MRQSCVRNLAGLPNESFDSGIAKTIRWYLDNEAWWRAILTGEYQGERLGLGLVA